MSQQFSGAAAIRAAVMIMGSTYVTYAVGLLVSIVIARHLGPDDYGRYAYVVWMSGMLLAVANNGLTSTSIRFVSESLGRESPESARRVHGWLLRRQIACMVLVALGFIATSRWLAPDGWQGPLAWFVLVALVAGLAKAVYIFDSSVAKGYGRFDVEARATVAMSVLNLEKAYSATEEALDPHTSSLRALETAQGLYDDAYLPATAHVGANWQPFSWTNVGASYREQLTTGRLAGRWGREVSVGIQQRLPLIVVRAGYATNLEEGSMISGGLSLGPIQLGAARLEDGVYEGAPRSGWIATFGLGVMAK